MRSADRHPNPSANEELYALLPQLGELLERAELCELAGRHSRPLVVRAARRVLARLRQQIAAGGCAAESVAQEVAGLEQAIAADLAQDLRPSLRPVVNATGVVLHTGLGRAPLGQAAISHIAEIAGGYCNLELDLATGERGRRDTHAESLLLRVLALSVRGGAGSSERGVIVVNNCAAATMLALNSLAEGGEVVVSRGELVEIGGGFRVPEIMAKSGAVLREVGTTNRTRIADYRAAITPQTKMILRVHQSNFRIEGFNEKPALTELVELAKAHDFPLFEDQGTGCLVSLEEFGIERESSLTESIGCGVPLVAASGDKLLGGPQCGILVGHRALIEKMRGNPLLRALRVDKLTYAALEATLLDYWAGRQSELPILRMLATDAEQIRVRCAALAAKLRDCYPAAEVVATRSVVGGGTTPGASLASFAVALTHPALGATAFARALRLLGTPVLARVAEDRVLLDLRTVPPEQDELVARLLQESLENE